MELRVSNWKPVQEVVGKSLKQEGLSQGSPEVPKASQEKAGYYDGQPGRPETQPFPSGSLLSSFLESNPSILRRCPEPPGGVCLLCTSFHSQESTLAATVGYDPLPPLGARSQRVRPAQEAEDRQARHRGRAVDEIEGLVL
jgi:hypothetical protein